MKKLFIILLLISALGNLVGCSVAETSKPETTMSPEEEKQKLDYKYEPYYSSGSGAYAESTIEGRLKEQFYGTWYDRNGTTLTIDKFTINEENYRVDFISSETVDSLNISIPSQNDLSYDITTGAISHPSEAKIMRVLNMGEKTYYEFPPEQQNEFFVQKPKPQNDDTQTQQISESVIKKCYEDAKEQFKNWYLSNYSDSLGDFAFCRQRGDYKSQQTFSSVIITFDMTEKDVDPYKPIFTVVANYSVKGEDISLFSFDCTISQ